MVNSLLGRLSSRKKSASGSAAHSISVTQELLSNSTQLSPASSPHVFKIDTSTVVKTGEGIRLAEAAAMRLVREKTSVPVPAVLDAYYREDNGHGCIVMEYIEGQTLQDAWPTMNADSKSNITSQIRQHMDSLRGVKADFIGSVDRSHCEDQFFSADSTSFGPYESEEEFRNGLIDAIKERGQNSWFEMVIRFIKLVPQHGIVLTHGDLSPRNILIRDGQVVAFLDWEMSGFYPKYWEYVKTMFWSDWQSPWIEDGVAEMILQPYPTELALLLHAREIIW